MLGAMKPVSFSLLGPAFPLEVHLIIFSYHTYSYFVISYTSKSVYFFNKVRKKKSPSWPVSVTPPNPHPLFNKVSDFLKSLSLKLEVLIIVMQNKWKSWNCLPFVVWIQVRSTGTRLEGFNHSSLECSGRG